MEKINIAYILSSTELGGGNRSIELLVKGLHHPFVPYIVSPDEGPAVEIFRKLNLPVFIIKEIQPSKNIWKTWKSGKAWKKFFVKENIKIVHANDVFATRQIILFAQNLQIPVVCHLRFPFSSCCYKWVFKLGQPNVFIYNSYYMQQKLQATIQKYCSKSTHTVVYNAVDTLEFKPFTPQNKTMQIGIIANLNKVKGHEDFLEMASLLLHKNKQLLFNIIGGESSEKGRLLELQQYAENLKISPFVLFHGNIKKVAAEIQKLDIVVCTSHEEPFGRCIIEAMACAKPVVATRVGGIPEIIIPSNKTGFLVSAHSPKEMAHTVNELLDNPKLREEVGIKGLQRVQEEFTAQAHTTSISKIYSQILSLE